MDFLRLLESIRTPVMDTLMSAVTVLGDETVFMVLALAVFWCVSKRQGDYILAVGFAETNQMSYINSCGSENHGFGSKFQIL